MSTIALTLPLDAVTVTDGRATLTASVTNTGGTPARIVLGAFGASGAPAGSSASAWTTVDRALREVASGATEQYSVTFAPPAGTASGTYPVLFIAYSADEAPEEHADQARQVDVIVPAVAVVAPPPKKPWWPWAVGAALVLAVVGVVLWLVLRPGPPPPPVSTPTPTPTATASPTSVPPTVPFEGTVWQFTGFEDGTKPIPGTTITFSFDGKGLSGQACNTYFAPAEVADPILKMGTIRVTNRLCTGSGVMAQERRYLDELRACDQFVRSGRTLTLTGRDGFSLMFEAQ